MSARSRGRDSLADRVTPFCSVTVIDDAPAMTWSAVRIRPWVSSTVPVPVPVPVSVVCALRGRPNGPAAVVVVECAVMSTTPGASLA